MKKTNQIVLGALFMVAVESCGSRDSNSWTYGADKSGQKHDTVQNGRIFRYYNSAWYPVYTNGMICPGSYGRGYSMGEISRPGFIASPTAKIPVSSGSESNGRVTTGGFGSSANGEGGGE